MRCEGCFAAFRTGALDHHGEFYDLDFITPQWSAGPIDASDPKVDVAAVNPWIARMADEVADGVNVYPLGEPGYIARHVMPNVAEGAAKLARSVSDIAVIVPVMTIVGDSDEDRHNERELVRASMSFYVSTPSHQRDFSDRAAELPDTRSHMSTGFVEVPVIRSFDGGEDSPWSPREAELLAVTLELLQEHGYDRLTVDAVATSARASKATIYRRWPTKAELVLARIRFEGTRQVAVDPDTGTLRGDLLRLGEQIWAHVTTHASTIRAVLVEVSRSAGLDAMMQEQFLDQRKALMSHVLARAVGRGEIKASAITEDLWDVLPGYLIYRLVLTGRAPSHRTIRDLVDNVLFPGLTRHNA